MRSLLAIALALALGRTLAPNAVALQAEDTPPAPERRIDVIAADARGRRVDSLTAADFKALQGRSPQPIVAAEFVRDRGRVFGIFLDELHTTPGVAADRARDALVQFVRTGLSADDRIAVFKPFDSLQAITLTDAETAARAIERFAGRQGDYTPRSSFERNFLAGTPARIDAARAQIALSALNALTTHVGAAKAGRKTLVLVSGGLPRPSRVRGDEPLPTLDTVIRAANRSHVSIYPIDVSGVAEDADDPAREALRALAGDTAGRALRANADLAAGLNGVLSDASGYYVVTLEAGDQKPDDRFHAVDLLTTREGVSLRARRGYWSPVPAPVARAGREPLIAPIANKISPLIRPWFGMARGSPGETRVSFVWEPSPRVPGDRSRLQPPARIALTVSRVDTGATVFDGTVLPVNGVVDRSDSGDTRATFELPPGRLRLRMSIEDAASRQLDTDMRELVVGTFPGPLSLGTLQVFRARNAREFREIAADVEAVPVAARQFSRSERLLIRVPLYASGAAPAVSGRLLSRFGAARPLEVTRWPGFDGYQIDVPLAGLASGDYVVEVSAENGDGRAHDSVAIRVTP